VVVTVVALALSGSPAANLRVTVWPQGRDGPARVSTLWARFSRRNGCEIARWDRMAFLFGK
jgi:hypothetical protein